MVADRDLRFLVTVEPAVSAADLRASVERLLRGDGPVVAGSVASRVTVRAVGEVTRSGTRCHLVHIPVRLGALLTELHYDESELHGLGDALTATDGVLRVEPDVPVENRVLPLQEFLPGCTEGRAAAPADVAWATGLIGLPDLTAPRPTGAGVRIGHIDTGFTDHPELDAATRFDLPACTSTVGIFGGDGTDPMPGGTSHGTATASILTSKAGTSARDDRDAPSAGITGLAPGVKVVAVRAIEAVVVVEALFAADITEAVWHCIQQGCHVITMSFGGLLGPATEDAIREAYERDIVLCAAAGNCVGFVVEPASLAEVVACGAVSLDPGTGLPRPWRGTSHGSTIDICAPGGNVWIADFVGGQARVRPGEGTSFAAPHVAGAAALWIQRHARAALLSRYAGSGVRLGDVFRTVLGSSARRPQNWDTARFGPGILHLPSMLSEPLPQPAAVPRAGGVDVVDAGVADFLDRITVSPQPVPVVVELAEVTVRDDGEFFGGAEPYLMAVRLLVDGTTARIDATFTAAELLAGNNPLRVRLAPAVAGRSFVRTTARGGHGNLDPVNIGGLELQHDGPKVLEPDGSVRRWAVDVQPIPLRLTLDLAPLAVELDVIGIPGFVGVLAMLAEEDGTTADSMRAARDAIADGIGALLEDVLKEITLADLSVDPEAFPERVRQIRDVATAAAAKEMNLWDAFWGGIVDPDDQLFQVLAFTNVAMLGDPLPVAGDYEGEHGDWTLVGEIRTGR